MVSAVERTQPQSMRRFLVIWSGQVFSWLGSELVQFALVWWLTKRTGSATVLALSTMVAVLPKVFIGPFAGAFVDRWNRRIVMVVSDGTIALATVLLTVLYRFGSAQIWHVYVLMFVRSVGGLLHWPAMSASTSLMVPEKYLARVAGLNQTLYGVIRIAGPPLGALLLELLPMQGVLAIDVGTAAIAIAPLLFIPVPQPVGRREAESANVRAPFVASVLSDMGDGMRFIWRWTGLRILLGIVMLLNILCWPMTSLTPILITSHFGGGAFELGWFESASGIGAILGGLVLSTWGGFKRRIVSMLVALILLGIGVTAIGLTPADAFLLAVGAWFVVGFASSSFNSISLAVLQAIVPAGMQGRVFTMQLSVATAMAPLGLAIAGPASDALGPQIWFLVTGVALTAAGAGGVFASPLMRIEDGVSPDDPALDDEGLDGERD
jgi:DHA3 family macrolide efflux protein-like MFS transporter